MDDVEEHLTRLATRLEKNLEGFKVETWQPKEEEGPPSETFDRLVGQNTELVVTDYDLSTTIKGLFGLTIVAWCQSKGIPVGEYSRLNEAALPPEPNLFELRVPTDEEDAAEYVTGVFNGFRNLRESIERHPEVVESGGSLAGVLAVLLGRPYLESQFAAYMSWPNAANAFLLGSLSKESTIDIKAKQKMFTYVLGHVLVNAVLKYPGPILTDSVLCAYLAIGFQSFDSVKHLFENARYKGPFSGGRCLYWRDDVDKVLGELSGELALEDFDSIGDFNRETVKKSTGGGVTAHGCIRCTGSKGGFWCPFTNRAICERADCSVPGSSWIPAGAQLCRIERVFLMNGLLF